MRHHLSPEDLQNKNNFELIDVVLYQNIKAFILKTLQQKSKLIFIYSIVQLFAIVIAIGTFSVLAYYHFRYERNTESLKWFLISIVFSFTFLIPIHELIHALAFLILGKKAIGFGVQLRKFIFYAEADKQVLNRLEMSIVAFAPLVLIGGLTITLGVLIYQSSYFFFCLGIFLTHFVFCSGDIAIVSYFSKKKNIYSYDDKNEKKTYFYLKKEST